MFEHDRVVNQPCNAQGELLSRDWAGHSGLDDGDPNSAPFQGLPETLNTRNYLV